MANNKSYDKQLGQIYYNPENSAGFSTVQKLWLAVEKNIPKSYIEKYLSSQKTYTINRANRKKFKRLHYELNNIGDLWQIDLIDFTNLAKYNNNYKFILICIDGFSKYVWMEKMKCKSSAEALRAFKLISKNHICRNLMSDSGKEFVNKKFQNFLKQEEINFFQNVDDATHASIVERAILTIKRRLYKYFYYAKTYRYIDVYKKICKSYNSTIHSAIGMKPSEVCDKNIVQVYQNLQKKYPKPQYKKPKFSVGMFVRISTKKQFFSKGTKGENFTEEIFKICGVYSHSPPMYKIEDLLGEIIKGKFYESELQRIHYDSESYFDINEIIQKRKRNGTTELLVTWCGWPKKFSSWIKETDIKQ